MNTFKLISHIWIGCNMSGCDYYVANTDQEFELIAGTLKNESDVTVRELVRFPAGAEPPPMIGQYYAIWKDKANCWKCFECKNVADMEMVKGWRKEHDDLLFFATEAVL